MDQNPLILGREAALASPFGFQPFGQPEPGSLIHYDGEAPLTIVAPTGSGKGRDVLIPAPVDLR